MVYHSHLSFATNSPVKFISRPVGCLAIDTAHSLIGNSVTLNDVMLAIPPGVT